MLLWGRGQLRSSVCKTLHIFSASFCFDCPGVPRRNMPQLGPRNCGKGVDIPHCWPPVTLSPRVTKSSATLWDLLKDLTSLEASVTFYLDVVEPSRGFLRLASEDFFMGLPIWIFYLIAASIFQILISTIPMEWRCYYLHPPGPHDAKWHTALPKKEQSGTYLVYMLAMGSSLKITKHKWQPFKLP